MTNVVCKIAKWICYLLKRFVCIFVSTTSTVFFDSYTIHRIVCACSFSSWPAITVDPVQQLSL